MRYIVYICNTKIFYEDKSYKKKEKRGIAIFTGDGAARQLEGLEMKAADSARIFGRSGEIARIEVQLQPGLE